MKTIKNIFYDIKNNKMLLIMLLPTIIYFFIFAYIPMAGIVLAFKRYNFSQGIFNSPWIGFDNFKFFFMSGQAFTVTRNTVLYNAAFIIIGTVMQLSLAIFLSELKKRYFKKIAQSVMLLPYFVSWVVVGAIAYNFFSYDYGILNQFLSSQGFERIDVYTTPWVWKYILIFFNIWKYAGYSSIVYLAAIAGIDKTIYEAAEIDGANQFHKIFHITLPSLKPVIFILTLLSIGRIFRADFGLFYQLVGDNGLLFNVTDVIDTFVFRTLRFSHEFGMAAASGLYQSILCFITLTFTNYIVRKHDEDYALF